MGGDFAPENVVAGAIDALRETNDRFHIQFIGAENSIKASLGTVDSHGHSFSIIPAAQVVEMHDGAATSIRQKKDSSIVVGLTLQHNGESDAFVSAGHTGAVMSASTLVLGRLDGVGRPTIGAFLPSERGVCLLVDAGANVDCKPQHLYEFAIMGSIYAREMFRFEHPTVGLLNIGEEDSKGNETVKEAHKLLKNSTLNFIGNVEGRDILSGKAQVVVCDGFVGNVLLKFGESVPAFFKSAIKQSLNKSIFTKMLGGMMRTSMRSALKGMDYEEQGGVPVLGVNGVSMIGHGKSTPKAIKNMILKAEEMVRKNIHHRIEEVLAHAA